MKKLLLILAIALTSCASKNPNVLKYEKQKEEREAQFVHTDKLIHFMKLLNVDCIEDETEDYKLSIKLK